MRKPYRKPYTFCSLCKRDYTGCLKETSPKYFVLDDTEYITCEHYFCNECWYEIMFSRGRKCPKCKEVVTSEQFELHLIGRKKYHWSCSLDNNFMTSDMIGLIYKYIQHKIYEDEDD